MGVAFGLGLLSDALLFLLICGMAGSCDARLLMQKFKQFKGILAGLICQFVLLPAMGFLSLSLFPQVPSVAVTLLVVTTSPGGGFSGWWCFLCNADLALSVAMTTASTLVSVFALPLNLYLYINLTYGRAVEIDYMQLLLAVVIVIAAVICGSCLSIYFPSQRQRISLAGQVAGVAMMAVGAMANGSSHDPLWDNPMSWFVAITLPVAGGLTIAMIAAKLVRLPSPEAVAVAIECCYQNTGLALTIALSAMSTADIGEASGVPLFYGIIEILVIPLFALTAWRVGWTYASPTENICVVLVGNYQPSAVEVAAEATEGSSNKKEQRSTMI